ncbi:uncharacterized protein [Spinacia oleracea]|uniref:Uncharacterized protein isoform X2 n=1 Tax=Spinacia oleracea TaxID=3562 RepID=A0ABM3R4P2_SPIOL|nr:uncharacterized protein LOC110777870 isoform X2 [Spinacia oleracea]
MAKGPSYLTNVDDLTLNEEEGSGDNELDNDIVLPPSTENQSPPRSVMRKVSRTTTKRKTDESIDSNELKRKNTSFDAIIKLLADPASSSVVSSGVGPYVATSRAERVSAALTSMGVCEKRGDEYYVATVRYLRLEDHAENFLTLKNDNQRWVYLRELDVAPIHPTVAPIVDLDVDHVDD